MNNSYIVRLIQQSIKQFKLDLTGLNILIPVNHKEPSIMPLIATMANAKNIYIQSLDINAINEIANYQKENNVENIQFVDKETYPILSSLDIIIKGGEVSQIDSKYLAALKKDCVISIYPENFDFYNVQGINLEECTKKKIPVISVNPCDSNLMLFKYLSQVVIKRFNEINLDLFRSRTMLVGSGELFDNTLSLLKTCGSHVYSANLDIMQDKSYVLKHLADSDAIVVVDYPQKHGNIIGTDGFITIENILDINPDIKIVHLAGKLQVNPLALGSIFFTPDKIKQNTLSIGLNDMGLRSIIEMSAATIKAAETLIKVKNRSVLSSESVISYDIVNTDGPVVLGRIMF